MRLIVVGIVMAALFLVFSAGCDKGPGTRQLQATSSGTTSKIPPSGTDTETPLKVVNNGSMSFIAVNPCLDTELWTTPSRIMELVDQFQTKYPELVVVSWHEYYTMQGGPGVRDLYVAGVFLTHRPREVYVTP